VRDQVSHPDETIENDYTVYFNLYIFEQQTGSQKMQAFPEISLLIISSLVQFWYLMVVPRYLNCCILSKDLLLIFMLLFSPLYCSWHINI